jgi:hypothetical protein
MLIDSPPAHLVTEGLPGPVAHDDPGVGPLGAK